MKNLRELAGQGTGCWTRAQAVKFFGGFVDFYLPNGDKELGVITEITSEGYTVRADQTGEKHTYTFLNA